ncbi:MAG: response regulator [Gammaproteobacteria bacterium]|nr:response regulator [Gammaproteobacteria bacterium]
MNSDRQTQKILIVDDVPANIKVLIAALKNPAYELLASTSGEAALEVAAFENPDLILLDIMMPKMDGYEVCKRLKADNNTMNIPVIFITAMNEEENEAKGLELGAADYITKPISPPIVNARVKTQLKLRRAYEELKKKNAALEDTMALRENVERITRHDLKTPLNGIITLPEMLMEELEDPSQREILELIEASGYQMLDMINNSLDLYKMETGSYQYQPASVNILQTAHKIAADTKNLAWKNRLRMDILVRGRPAGEREEFIIQGEALLCYSMLANLIKNALEASPEGECITISLDEEDEASVIGIHNKGVIPENIRNRFFDKYTTSGKSQGTGLGTYSARLMAETLGGSIHLETSDEEDITVTIRLPKE